ncbi:MAG: hypothetical protein JWL84_2525 [Rhodospirillales bacterium]|nr:hypothetical protein [Rhodospirillales bacterium]
MSVSLHEAARVETSRGNYSSSDLRQNPTRRSAASCASSGCRPAPGTLQIPRRRACRSARSPIAAAFATRRILRRHSRLTTASVPPSAAARRGCSMRFVRTLAIGLRPIAGLREALPKERFSFSESAVMRSAIDPVGRRDRRSDRRMNSPAGAVHRLRRGAFRRGPDVLPMIVGGGSAKRRGALRKPVAGGSGKSQRAGGVGNI